jgi:hypothetical protein
MSSHLKECSSRRPLRTAKVFIPTICARSGSLKLIVNGASIPDAWGVKKREAVVSPDLSWHPVSTMDIFQLASSLNYLLKHKGRVYQ